MTPSLVIGGRGLIGTALVRALTEAGEPVVYTTRDSALAAKDQNARFLDLRAGDTRLPDLEGRWVVYLVAGVGGRERCAADPDAWRVNADAPRMLAYQASCRGWPVMLVSTGYVELDPLCAYAQQKIAVEAVVLTLGGSVVRPRGRVTRRNVREFVEFMGAACRPGVHWWGGE